MTHKAQVLSFVCSFTAILAAIFGGLMVVAPEATAQNPQPLLSQPLVPDTVAPGVAGFTLTVNGTGFVPTSVVNWNGSPRATTFVSKSQLTAAILGSDVATATTAAITVASPGPGGGTSNVVFFPINTPTVSVAFDTTDLMPGAYPLAAITADFNHDGKPDLALASEGYVEIYLGNGDGTFQNPVVYSSDYVFPNELAAGDFNGDGKLDLAVTANYAGVNGVSVLGIMLGNGDGTFQAPVYYKADRGGTDVVAADFNGDGKLDCLMLNGSSETVSVLLGNGDGTFQSAVNYKVRGSGSTVAAVGDFNGDGLLDVAVSNSGSNDVSILLGNGDGTFKTAVRYPAGAGPAGVNVADINGDGILDLIVPNSGSPNVSILLGRGDGSFAAPVNYPVSASAIRAEVGDFNQDGKLDVAVATSAATIDLLLGNGDGTFQPATSSPSVANAVDVVVADFNQDGLLDIVVPDDTFDSLLAVMLQTTEVGSTPTSTTLTSSPSPSAYGQPVTFAATVTANSGTPTGVVVLFDGTTSVSRGNLASGSVSMPVSSLPVGQSSITAAYQGSSLFARSTSAPLTQTVNRASTTTTLAASAHPAHVNERITYTASVSGQYGGAATGTVVFQDNGATIATVAVSGNQAATSTSYASEGTHSVVAIYSGDTNYTGSTSSTLIEKVEADKPPYTTETMVATSQSTVFIDHSVTFTATVTSLYGTIPDGETVTFYDGRKDDQIEIGTGTTSGGMATFTTSSLPAEALTITAVYAGDPTFKPSSGKVKQVVNLYPTTTTVSASGNPACAHDQITFTAVVTSAGGPTPTGQVFFTAIGGYVTLVDGVAKGVFRGRSPGRFGVTAKYEGDAFNAKSSSAAYQERVIPCNDGPTE